MPSSPARRAAAGKIGLALAVFAAIFGSWTVVQSQAVLKTSPTALPDAGGHQGACVLWFMGSSSIHNWTSLESDMRPWIAHNRGVGGATLAEVRDRFSAEPTPPPPEAIVLYAGENDIAAGKTAADTVADLGGFLAVKNRKFGDVPVFVISLKPTPGRWADRPAQVVFNDAARAIAKRRSDVIFIDVVDELMVGDQPGPFYNEDGIHMNAAGYRLWAGSVQRALAGKLPSAVNRRCGPTGPAAASHA